MREARPVATRVTLRVPRNRVQAWHHDLVARLATLPGVAPTVALAPAERAAGWLTPVLRLERLLHRLPAPDPVPPLAPRAADVVVGPDLVLDLTADPVPGAWTVRYDGRPGEAAAVAAVTAGSLPYVEVLDGHGVTRAAGRPGCDIPGLVTTALPDLFAGVATLLVGAVTGRGFAPPLDPVPSPVASSPGVPSLLAGRLTGALVHRAHRALCRAPHWRVGWRWGPVPTDQGGPAWRSLPDDGWHFYADPFPFEHDGRRHLFVEDFDHRRGKAVISVVEVGPDGPLGTPECVLEHEVHLSYPFVLAHDGEVWMIPETSQAGTVELYRAVDYPRRWVLDRVLLAGVEAGDATPFRHDGRWWLSATVRQGGSASDALHLWSAPDLRGPWIPHRANPVLVDVAGARPAGRVLEEAGRLVRPAQDCRGGYGRAVNLFEVLRLDDEGFEQRLVARVAPGEAWPGNRLHTWNRVGALECIDGSRLVPRTRAAYRRVTPWLERPATAGGAGSSFVVAREDDLDLRGPEYARLFAASEATAFQDGAWLERVYGRLAPALGARPCVVTVRHVDGELVGVLPLVHRRVHGVRVVEYADLGVADYAQPVVAQAWREAVAGDPTLAPRVRRALGGHDLVRVDRVPDDPDSLRSLLGARARRHSYGTHTVKLAGSAATWREGLEPGFVRHLERKYRRLRPKGGARLRVVTDPAEVPGLIALLRDLRAVRFAERGGTDLLQSPDHVAFYATAALDGVLGVGPARLVVLDVGGHPAAVALDLVEEDRELFLLVGYDVGRLRNYSLGLLVVDRLAHDAIDRGLAHLDLTVGDEAYKRDFGAEPRPLFQLHRARTPVGLLAHLGGTARDRARQEAKRLLGPQGTRAVRTMMRHQGE